jgi:hypothetical protein
MVSHTAVFCPKEGVTEEQIQGLFEEAHALVGVIPGLVSVIAGRQVRGWSADYSWGFTMILDSKAALDAYYPHPAHRAFAEKFKAVAETIIDFDIIEMPN